MKGDTSVVVVVFVFCFFFEIGKNTRYSDQNVCVRLVSVDVIVVVVLLPLFSVCVLYVILVCVYVAML